MDPSAAAPALPSPLYCVLSHLIGTVVTVSLKDGRHITGLLSYDTLLQMDKRMLLVDLGKDNTGGLHFETVRVALEKVKSIKGQTALKSGPLVSTSFKTDTSISNRQRGGERELQRWQGEAANGGSSNAMDYSLIGSKGEKWDQFTANQRLFGIQTSFDEHQYTTVLRKDTPEFRARMEEAERIAKDIEGKSALNGNESARVAEERGQEEEESDEEALFSEVKRESTSGSKLNINAAEYVPAPPTPEKRRPYYNNNSYSNSYYQQQQQAQQYYGTVYFNAPAYYPSMPQDHHQDYYYYDDSADQPQFY